jgi:hypothetical protein
VIQTQASPSQSVMPVEQGIGTVAHCPIEGCPHVVTAKRQGQAWLSLSAHIVYAHHPELAHELAQDGR